MEGRKRFPLPVFFMVIVRLVVCWEGKSIIGRKQTKGIKLACASIYLISSKLLHFINNFKKFTMSEKMHSLNALSIKFKKGLRMHTYPNM